MMTLRRFALSEWLPVKPALAEYVHMSTDAGKTMNRKHYTVHVVEFVESIYSALPKCIERHMIWTRCLH